MMRFYLSRSESNQGSMGSCFFSNIIVHVTLVAVAGTNILVSCCRIWSWSPVPCEKHGPRDSVDKNRGQRPRFLSLLRPEGHVFHTAWETMIKCYYSTLADWLFSMFYSHKYEFLCFKMGNFWLTSWLLGKSHCCYGLVAKGHKWILVLKTWIPALLD